VAGTPPGQGTHTFKSSHPFISSISRFIWDILINSWTTHQDTTGALLLARSRLKARELQVQFKERQIKKTYLALVRAGKDVFPDTSGSIRNVLAYDLDGRFQRVVPVRANAGKGKDASRGGSGGGVGKSVETVTHWRLLWSSVRPLPLVLRSTYKLRLVLTSVSLFGGTFADESAGIVAKSRARNRIEASASSSFVGGTQRCGNTPFCSLRLIENA
jgi:hypothetical protein